ncbi:MAG: FRG domain-containing protein [Candidatus Methylumidiphilus sp.]
MSKKNDITTERIDSVAGLLQRVVELYTGNHSVLFRGHQVADWILEPRIARTKFRPRHSAFVLKAEQRMLDEFERLSVPYLAGREISSPWDRLALAQHHGLPTRLLDWSTNPLVALWFAVAQPPYKNYDAAIWAYEANEDNIANLSDDPFNLPRTQIFRPRHHDARIVAQSGWFTVHKYSTASKRERFSALDRIEVHRSELRKLIVPRKYFASIREDLARCGIQRCALFPDLSGLCGHLLWQFSPLTDETDYDVASSL